MENMEDDKEILKELRKITKNKEQRKLEHSY